MKQNSNDIYQEQTVNNPFQSQNALNISCQLKILSGFQNVYENINSNTFGHISNGNSIYDYSLYPTQFYGRNDKFSTYPKIQEKNTSNSVKKDYLSNKELKIEDLEHNNECQRFQNVHVKIKKITQQNHKQVNRQVDIRILPSRNQQGSQHKLYQKEGPVPNYNLQKEYSQYQYNDDQDNHRSIISLNTVYPKQQISFFEECQQYKDNFLLEVKRKCSKSSLEDQNIPYVNSTVNTLSDSKEHNQSKEIQLKQEFDTIKYEETKVNQIKIKSKNQDTNIREVNRNSNQTQSLDSKITSSEQFNTEDEIDIEEQLDSSISSSSSYRIPMKQNKHKNKTKKQQKLIQVKKIQKYKRIGTQSKNSPKFLEKEIKSSDNEKQKIDKVLETKNIIKNFSHAVLRYCKEIYESKQIQKQYKQTLQQGQTLESFIEPLYDKTFKLVSRQDFKDFFWGPSEIKEKPIHNNSNSNSNKKPSSKWSKVSQFGQFEFHLFFRKIAQKFINEELISFIYRKNCKLKESRILLKYRHAFLMALHTKEKCLWFLTKLN